MNYTSNEVVKRLKQYDMFLNSLNLTADEVQKERICDQLDKIEKQILLDTNSEYEEEYLALTSKETKLLDEEKKRLKEVISLIVDRREYLNKRKENHEKVTGSLVELTTFNGEDKLSFYKKKLKIIEKYQDNKIEKEKIIKEMKTLDVKISEASRNVKANMRLNDMLENKMIDLVGKALDKLDLYSLTMEKDKILDRHSSLSYARKMALDNLTSANDLDDREMISECNDMLSEITEEFLKYDEMINIIELIEIYDSPVSDYDELLKKREKINGILKNITGSKLYNEINGEISKEYNTIKLEKQDIKNYDDLKSTRESKNKRLYEIDEENNSREFKEVLDDLIRNEDKYLEEKVSLARQQESLERDKKIQEEQRIEASRVKRQKLIEEAKLKEQRERTEKLKELQSKTVIIPEAEKKIEQHKKEEIVLPAIEEEISFEEMPREEKINNPLENKTLDEIIEFNTDELFENTKIVPNRVSNKTIEESIFKEAESQTQQPKSESNILPTWEPISEETKPLFKDESKIEKIELPKAEEKVPEQPFWTSPETTTSPIWNTSMGNQQKEILESKQVSERNSIYDVLENNENIIWKTTETKEKFNDIPVIKNSNSQLPKNDSKEGDMLWKETL